MDWTSAPIIEDAPLEPAHRRFLPAGIGHFPARVEAFLERERAQLPLWFIAAFGAGIAARLWLPGPGEWLALVLIVAGLAVGGIGLGPSRIGRALLFGGRAMAAGSLLIWWRATGSRLRGSIGRSSSLSRRWSSRSGRGPPRGICG